MTTAARRRLMRDFKRLQVSHQNIRICWKPRSRRWNKKGHKMTLFIPGGSSRRRERSTDREQHHAVECRHLWTTRNSFWGETRSDNYPTIQPTSLTRLSQYLSSFSVLQTFWSVKKHFMLAAIGEGWTKFPLGDPPLPEPSLTLSISLSLTIYLFSKL